MRGVGFDIHYLDDFLLMGGPGSGECEDALEKLLEIFQCLGLPVVPGKLEGPSTRLVFLGFELDTKEMVVRLPDQKLREVRDLVSHWRGKSVYIEGAGVADREARACGTGKAEMGGGGGGGGSGFEATPIPADGRPG